MKTASKEMVMASPQAENGHTDIAHELVEAFYKLQLSGNQWRILWVILRQTYGWHKKQDRISISFFEEKTGLKRRHISRVLEDLVNRKIITKNDATYITTYGLQKDHSKWQLSPKKTYDEIGEEASPKMTLRPSPKLVHTKEIKETSKKKEVYSDYFLTFWTAYPRKIGKDAAWKAWKKRDGDMPPLDDILSALEKQKQTPQWRKDDGQFIPYPTTWINHGRWTDDIPEAKPSW